MFNGNSKIVLLGVLSVTFLIVGALMLSEGRKPIDPLLQQGDTLAAGDKPLPAIMPVQKTQSNSDGEGQGSAMVPGLEMLVSGLENKVNADPTNVSNRILLAQTYAELGRLADGMAILKEIRQKHPNNSQAAVALAAVLIKTEEQDNLKSAITILDDSIKRFVDVRTIAVFHKAEAMDKLGKPQEAKDLWKGLLGSLPKGDQLRPQVEQKLAGLE